MGARDEKTQEAAYVNHKPSLLGVKYRGRSIASLTFSYRLQISVYKKKNFCYSGTQIPVLEVSWSTWSWVLYWNNWASCSLSALLASLSAHHVSSHGTENSQNSAVCTFLPANSGITAKHVLQPNLEDFSQKDLIFPKDSWDFVPSEHDIFKICTKEVGKATWAS